MVTIYNGRYTFINGTEEVVELPDNVEEYKYNLNTLNTIKSYEIQTHKLYNGHIIYREKTDIDFNKILKLDLDQNKIYSSELTHSGRLPECYINMNFIICSSWMLPFVLDSNSDYAYLRKHRAKLFKYQNKTVI